MSATNDFTAVRTEPEKGPVFAAAFRFAEDRHRGQRRKGERPTAYIEHPAAVADILRRVGRVEDPVVLAAALLHDVVEDTGTSLTEIAGMFGPEVAAVVAELTDKPAPKKQRRQLQIARAKRMSPRARLVRVCDKISNLISIIQDPPTKWSREERLGYVEFAEQVVDGLKGYCEPLESLFWRSARRGPAAVAPGPG